MKTVQNITFCLLLILSIIWGWNASQKNKKVEPPIVELPEIVITAPQPVVVVEEIPQDVVVPQPIAPKLDIYYPEGEYVTKENISQITDTGAVGIRKGEKVKKVGEKDGKFLITNGKVTVESTLGKLTNEKAVGDALLSATNTPPQIIEMPVETPQIAKEQPTPEITRPLARDTSAIDAQIAATEKKIRELKAKSGGKINAHGPVITRYEILLEKLKAQRNYK